MNSDPHLMPRPVRPAVVIVKLLLAMVAIEIVIVSVLPLLLLRGDVRFQMAADAFCLAILTAPVVWWLIARPLRAAAAAEVNRTKAALEHVVDAVIHFDADGVIRVLNPAAERMFGYPAGELVGENVVRILPCLKVEAALLPLVADSAETWRECWTDRGAMGHTRDGRHFPVDVSVSNVQPGRTPAFIAIVHDITTRRQVEAELAQQQAFAESLVQNSAVPTFVIGADHRTLIWNRACEELTGVRAEEMLGRNEAWRAFYPRQQPVLADLVIDGIGGNFPDEFSAVGRSNFIPEGLQSEGWYRNLNGMDRYIFFNAAPLRNAEGELLAVIETLEEITDRKRYEEQLAHQANHDGGTELPNRNLLTDRLHQAILQSRRSGQQVVVFLVDLDQFKFINDSLGYDVGDMLLKRIAQRLTGCVRAEDTVARLGGDEFVVVMSDPAATDNASRIGGKLLDAVSCPLRINDHDLTVTCSIGISIYPKDGADVQTLLKNADVAMFRSKEQGRNTCTFYTEEMNARSLARLTMERHLRRALERNELLLHFQPKVSLRTGRITGMEALIRWQNPELGMIPPGSFIPLAEEIGLIEQIGEWVIRTACAWNRAWHDAGLPPLPVAVNVSPRQFREKDIAGMVDRLLGETGLDPRFLEIEITESLVMQDLERATSVLDALKRLGTSLSMDDFGTGYSSLSYLKRFPFDKLKIDQAFVREITTDPDSAAIVRAVIAMAHSLRLKVIAEGVETEGQLRYLDSLGCDEMQGYYFSRPVPAGEFEQLLRDGRELRIPDGNRDGSERTLLVVDDDEEIVHSLQRMLALDGYTVLGATCAEKGFDLLAINRVPVVISDLRMPGMDGNEFLGRVKELYPDTVRILFSGNADLESVADAVNRGTIYKFLSKPWDDDVLRAKVEEAFAWYRSCMERRVEGRPDDGGRG